MIFKVPGLFPHRTISRKTQYLDSFIHFIVTSNVKV